MAGLTEKEFLKLRDAYHGNMAAMAMAIKKGKEGEKLQKSLAKVSKEHKEAIDKQKGAVSGLSGALSGELNPALIEAAKTTQTWTDYIKDIGLKTIEEKRARVEELEGILDALKIAYDQGKLSLEDYNKAVETAHNELGQYQWDAQAAADASRGFGESLDVGNLSLNRTALASVTAQEKLAEFARQSGITTLQVQKNFYSLSQSVMSLAGVHIPNLVLSNKAAWPQIRDEAFTQVSQRIKDAWTMGLKDMLSGAKSFKDVMGGIWGTIKEQFFTLVAQLVSKWTLGLIGGIVSGSGGLLNSVKGAFSGIGNLLTGSGSGTGSGGLFGNIGGSFLGTISKMAGPIGLGLLAAKFLDLKQIGKAASEAISSALEAVGGIIKGVGKVFESVFGAGANIIAGIGNTVGALGKAISSLGGLLSKGGKKYEEITYWLKPIAESNQNILNQLVGFFHAKLLHIIDVFHKIHNYINVIKTLTGAIRDKIALIASTKINTAANFIASTISKSASTLNATLKEIVVTINKVGSGIASAQHGAVITKPQLVMTHGTPSAPEFIMPTVQLQRLLQDSPQARPTKQEIKIINEINLTGTIISDREYARQRLIPEIINALDVNAEETKRKLKRAL